MFDIITFGSATQDIIVKPKHLTSLKYEKSFSEKEVCFPMGSKIDVDQMDFYSGGGGTNAAATFTLQGFKTAFCGAMGIDVSGKKILSELKKLKINTSFVRLTKEKLTNHSVIISNDGQDRTIFAYRGAAESLKKEDIPWSKLKTKWIYLAPLSGLLCLPAGRRATTPFEDLVEFAKKNNIKIAANPGIAQLSLPNFSEIAKKIDILVLNQEEASFLTKIPLYGEQETRSPFQEGVRSSTQKDLSALVFKKINEICNGISVMTKGGEGVVVSDGKYIYYAKPPIDRKVVDTTGAGDSFGSGFVAEFIRSGNVESSIQFAMANSVGNLSKVGAKTGLLKKGQKFEKVEVVKESI